MAVAALVVGLAAGPLSTGAVSQTSDGTTQAKNPLAGDGMWIWYLSHSSHGKLGAIAKKARANGIETVLIKSGDGTGYWSQFSPSVVSGLHSRGLNVCAWQFIYGRKPGKEAKVGARAVANGADCLVLDVEGQYEGRYPQASYFMSSLRSRIGQDYPVALASFPYVDYHPALPFSVFLGPGGAQYNLPQLYWKDIGTTVDTGFIHTWVWNRIYQRPILPLGQVYNNPKAGQIKRFRALAMSHGFEGVSWWSWQSAGKRQWKALRTPVAPASTPPYPSYPFLRLGSKGDFVAWAQQLLAGAGFTAPITGYYQALDPVGGLLLPGRQRSPPDRKPRRPDLERAEPEERRAGHLDEERRGGVSHGRTPEPAAAALGEAAGGAGRDSAPRQARAIAARSSRGRN